jgi:signal transduction histidine kinase
MAVIAGYSAATSGLFPVNDGIADQSGNYALISNTRALGSLSRMADHASQQQAILGVALAEGRFEPGALTALTTAQAQQAGDLASFRGSALPQESWALTQTLAGTPARQAQAVEQRAIAAGGGALALGPQASQQWSAGMSYTVGWMDHAGQELAAWIPAYAQTLQRNAMRSAMVAGGAGLGALVLVLLGTMFAARSIVRRRRLLDAAALDGAAVPLPSSTPAPMLSSVPAPPPSSDSTVFAGFFWRSHSLLEQLLRLIDSSELNEGDPERLARLFEMDHLATRIRRNSDSALVLTGYETPHAAEPLALLDVLRAAASEIAEYGRVTLDVQQGVRVSGSAAADTVHLLAELLENATTFSVETTQVIVSGHAVVGGGSLITITDAGAGMSEEELTLLNEQLVSPSLTDIAAAPRMGLAAVALLAARHGITVTLSMQPDSGTTAEVYLPAALISLDAEAGGWRGPAGEATAAETSAAAAAEVADLPLAARLFASGQEPPPGPETEAPEFLQLMLGAPVPSSAPGTSTGVTGPEPVGAEPGDGSPIFESVRSGYSYAFGRERLRFSDQQAGQSPAGQPATPWASRGDGSDRAAAGPPTAGRPASSGPQRVPQPGQVRGRSGSPGDQAGPGGRSGEEHEGQAGKPPAQLPPDADSGPAEHQRQAAWTGWLRGKHPT